jgi:hypothetical protein
MPQQADHCPTRATPDNHKYAQNGPTTVLGTATSAGHCRRPACARITQARMERLPRMLFRCQRGSEATVFWRRPDTCATLTVTHEEEMNRKTRAWLRSARFYQWFGKPPCCKPRRTHTVCASGIMRSK